ncbi:MAG: DNRLRE domain-containing protein, partial [Candidatus Aenigmatarchaeota archaeon]
MKILFKIQLVLFFIFLFIDVGYGVRIIFYPTDDTYVDGATPDTNYGLSSDIVFGGVASSRRGFLKFNLSGINATKIINATLYIYANSFNSTSCSGKLLFKRISDFGLNWSENNVTYNFQPPVLEDIYFYGINCCYYYGEECGLNYYCNFGAENILDVTEALKKEMINYSREVFTFQIYFYPNFNQNCKIFSKDHPNPNYHPKLVLEIEDNLTTTTITTTTITTTTTTISTTIPTTPTTTITTTTTSTTVITTTSTTIPQTTTTTIIAATSTTTIPMIQNFRKPIIIVKNDFYDILFASSFASRYENSEKVIPVIVWEENNERMKNQIKNFIEMYSPDAIFLVGMNYPQDLPQIRNYQINERYQMGNGLVIVDENRTKSLLGSFIAKLKNYAFIRKEQTISSDFAKDTICTFFNNSCKIVLDNEEKLIDYILDITKEKRKEVNYLVVSNVAKNEAALATRFDAIPIVIDVIENYSGTVSQINEKNKINHTKYKINNTIEKIIQKGLLGKYYQFNTTIFLSLLGAPYACVEDPWSDDRFDIQDGDILFTDNLYADINNDGYLELAIGRFCCSPAQVSLMIENSKLWNKNNKNVAIFSEYRMPKYLDLFFLDGMAEGFATEWALRIKGFNVTRFIEIRGENITEEDKKEIEKSISLNPEEWVSRAFDFLNLKKISNYKYKILEADWRDLKNLKKLKELNKSSFLSNIENFSIIFYFGMGDLKNLYFPSNESYFNPYPRDKNISASEIEFKTPKIFFDEHSLSAHPNSSFIKINNLVFIGSSGIVHDTYVFSPLISFLNSLLKNYPIGKAVNNMKLNIAYSNQSYSQGSIATSLTVLSPLKLIQKEFYQKMLYGDPSLVIDPSNYENMSYEIISNGNDFLIEFNFSPKYEIKNKEIVFETPQYFIYDVNKPIVPVFRKEIIVPSNIKNISFEIIEKDLIANIEPIILREDQFFSTQENFTSFPSHLYWIDEQKLFDNRYLLSINFAPVRYFRNSENISARIYEGFVRITYEPNLE